MEKNWNNINNDTNNNINNNGLYNDYININQSNSPFVKIFAYIFKFY